MLCISSSKLVRHQLHKYEVPTPQTVASPLGQEYMCGRVPSPSSSSSSSLSSSLQSSSSPSLSSPLPSSCLRPDFGAITNRTRLVTDLDPDLDISMYINIFIYIVICIIISLFRAPTGSRSIFIFQFRIPLRRGGGAKQPTYTILGRRPIMNINIKK